MSDEEKPKVVALRGGEVVTPAGEPVADVVELCESMLKEAKEGKLRALAVGMSDGHTAIMTTWRYDGVSNVTMLGIIELLKLRFERDEIQP